MHKLQVGGLPLPEVYVCRTKAEAMTLSDNGIPYIKTSMPDIDIVKVVLYRILRNKFPHIKWRKILGESCTRRLNVIVPGRKVQTDEDGDKEPISTDPNTAIPSDGIQDDAEQDEEEDFEEEEDVYKGHDVSFIAEDYREFDCEGVEDVKDRIVSVDDFCFDEASHVNIETLQALGFLPKFMDDAANAIRINLENRMMWRECWNKRLGAAVGDVDYSTEAANLIILDISGSIPEGISATMLRLVDSLRTQTNAEVIITGSTSMYWGDGENLPEPEWIRNHIGYGNESMEFFKILRDHIQGRHFGNVISFGDNDCPYYRFNPRDTPENNPLVGVQVDRVMHYHTTFNRETGYARWVKIFCPDAEQVIDTSWCEVMR